ncbi:MAG: hypothetical protein LC731_00160 [Acidobacteria bacterium]|nr:hypothetical protein [Acidobacteriota bacterium]
MLYIVLLILVGLISPPNSMMMSAPKSDLKAELKVTFDKSKKVFLVQGVVTNLGPGPSVAEGRTVRLIAEVTFPSKQSAGIYVIKQDIGPALGTKSLTVGQKNRFNFPISKEYPVSDDPNSTYKFSITLAQSSNDPNSGNDSASQAAAP